MHDININYYVYLYIKKYSFHYRNATPLATLSQAT